MAVDAAGNLFIADTNNDRIRQVSPDGVIRTVAGNGIRGFSGDGGPAANASLALPQAVAVDAAGNLFIADTENYRIRQVSLDGVIRTVAGNGILGFSGDGGPATNASLNLPQGMAVDAAGNLFIADSHNGRIRQVSPDGVIRTVAGNGILGFSGDGGPATDASLNFPQGVAVDAAGNLFIADAENHRIRQVSPDGVIRTVAGNGDYGFSGDGGPATNASLSSPKGVAVDAAGNLFIADRFNHRIRQVSPDGVIRTVAGNGDFDFSGDGGPATNASLGGTSGVAVDGAGNLFIADAENDRIRQVSPDGIILTVAGNGLGGFSGDGGPATNAFLSNPQGVAVDAAGNLFIADTENHRIRQVSPDGIIRTVAGNGLGGFSGDGGPATNVSLHFPQGVAVDAVGNLFIADSFNGLIRQVSPDGVIRTVAGNRDFFGFSGDGGPATNASLEFPEGVAVDAAGNLFIADIGNDRIRQVSPDGIIRTVAGNGIRGFSGDGGPATNASLEFPQGVAVDAAGNLFIADWGNHRIRQVSLDGIIRTVAGNGIHGFSGDGGLATNASLSQPVGVAVDAAGNLFIAEAENDRIRVVLAEPLRFSELSVREATLAARSGAAPVEAAPVLISRLSDQSALSKSKFAAAGVILDLH